MFNFHKAPNNITVAELTDKNILVTNGQDALELIGALGNDECTGIIIDKKNLSDDFFILSSGVAGDILQKFSNYQLKLAILGDFSNYTSKSLNDFIRECNRGNMIFFLDNFETAIHFLSGKY